MSQPCRQLGDVILLLTPRSANQESLVGRAQAWGLRWRRRCRRSTRAAMAQTCVAPPWHAYSHKDEGRSTLQDRTCADSLLGDAQVQKHAEKLQRAKEEAALATLRAQWPEMSEAVLVLALEDADWETDRATLLLHRFQGARGALLDSLAKARLPPARLACSHGWMLAKSSGDRVRLQRLTRARAEARDHAADERGGAGASSSGSGGDGSGGDGGGRERQRKRSRRDSGKDKGRSKAKRAREEGHKAKHKHSSDRPRKPGREEADAPASVRSWEL